VSLFLYKVLKHIKSSGGKEKEGGGGGGGQLRFLWAKSEIWARIILTPNIWTT